MFCEKVDTGVFLGGGAYAMPEALADAYPRAKIEVVEIDPHVTEVARRFFRLADYPQIEPIAGDARRHLRFTPKHYDIIFADAFNGVRYVPSHLLTQEFFTAVKGRLDEGGVFMMDIISAARGDKSQLFKMVLTTLRSVFDTVYVFAIDRNDLETPQNLILLASVHQRPFPNTENISLQNHSLGALLRTYVPPTEYDLSGAAPLTDNYNPIEYIVAKQL